MTRLSIITINLNNASGLQKTMESVFAQTSQEFEYIVIDGASTDGSKELIEQFSSLHLTSSLPHFLRWISEKDSGIYNAMNKGIRMAKGEYLQFLNSGDWLVDNNVVRNMLKESDHCDILVGNKISVRRDRKFRIERNDTFVSCFTFYKSTLHHTSAYIRRALFDQYGFYDESLKIVADWKWYLIAAGLNKCHVKIADINVSYFDTTGISSTNRSLETEERRKVLEELLPAPILADYDRYYFDIDQMERIKQNKTLYRFFWFIERCLFKREKWRMKYWTWKIHL